MSLLATTWPGRNILIIQSTRPTELSASSDCTAPVKAAAYSTLVRQMLKFSSTVWDPHQSSAIHNLEQVQRRATRFVHHNYTVRTPGCVTNMVRVLGGESLQHRFSMLFRVHHGLVDVTTDYIKLNDTRTTGSQRLRQLNAAKDVYKYSFYPRTICDWNQLPTTVTDVQILQEFRECISSLSSKLLRPY